MSRTPAAHSQDTTSSDERLFMAMELSAKKWKLALSNGEAKAQFRTIDAWDIAALEAAIASFKARFGLAEDAPVSCCGEAGRDGFSVHRQLEALGAESLVIDPASIAVNRRQRRAKTDKIDARELLLMLIRHVRGERGVWSVVRVPAPAIEDARRVHREHERLTRERTRLVNGAKSILAAHGVVLSTSLADALRDASAIRCWNGEALPRCALSELEHTAARLALVSEQLAEVDDVLEERLKHPETEPEKKAAFLARLRGIGPVIANVLAFEFFGWRDFRNRRQVGAAAGLTGTPYDTGQSRREQGISKAGNRRVRRIAIEASWLWLRWQGDSKLARWYLERFDGRPSRVKRSGIAALARKLLVALWNLLNHGVIPEGARLSVS